VISELSNVIQPYAWGSHTALAGLRGESQPTPNPEAELWMGTHPLAPSRLASSNEALPAVLEASPAEHLGPEVQRRYGAKLPFLLKVLAAGTPLSLQAHPSIAQAEAGFAADEAAGIALDSPERNYKDRNHKPELICALGEFWALCGFRDVAQTLELFDTLALPALLPYRKLLAAEPNATGISRVFSNLLQAPSALARELSEATSAACHAHRSHAGPFTHELRWVARLGELHPGDIGVVSALLLNLLRLDAGEAIYLPAGNLHAYLGGVGVELMANSDNVLRGGLTPKHVNVPELLHVLDFSPLEVKPLRAETHGQEHVYATPAHEFRLSYFELTPDAPGIDVPVHGPEIWLALRGELELRSPAGAAVRLAALRSAFVSAATGTLRLAGSGRIFRACVGLQNG
jgi:mannose-6-phosphate isomerase